MFVCGCKPPKPDDKDIKKSEVTNNHISVKMNSADTNRQFINTSLIFEVVTFIDDKGNEKEVLQTYDTGNSNWSIDYGLANELYGYKKADINMSIDNFATGVQATQGNRREI